ncbi:MAG: hypothetical protein JRN15_08030, partial [Nitrososphaerota archaeon]|nr:hypothetical protein [Nitrososphaerota archaeon]
DIEEALQGTSQDSKEFAKVKGTKGAFFVSSGAEEDPATPDGFDEPMSRGSVDPYLDKKFITKVNEQLVHWRTGWKRIFGESGSAFNLQRELATNERESFSTRERLEFWKSLSTPPFKNCGGEN